jgi:hypothetical protein
MQEAREVTALTLSSGQRFPAAHAVCPHCGALDLETAFSVWGLPAGGLPARRGISGMPLWTSVPIPPSANERAGHGRPRHADQPAGAGAGRHRLGAMAV